MPAIARLPGSFLFGHLLDFRRDRVGLLERLYRECGEIGELRLFHRVVVVSAPDLARAVLVDQAAAFEKGLVVREWSKPVLGTGILSCPNAMHRPQRRLVAPAFAAKHIARYADGMAAATEELVEDWFANGTSPVEVNLADEMMRLSLSVVGRALFSVDLLRHAPHLSAALELINRNMTGRIGAPLKRAGRAFGKAVATLDDAIQRMIDDRRTAGPPAGTKDFLSSLVFAKDDEEEGRVLDDRQVRDEAMTLFVAGHETSATALAWAWQLVTTNRDAYERLRAEAKSVLGGRTATYADVEKLTYARQVFQEAMRLYPPVHSIGRQAFQDVELRGHRIPTGRLLVVSTYLLHRRPDLWDEPLRFKPERFDKTPAPFTYLPFGHGPRVCIGNHFATVMAQISLATLAQRVAFKARAESTTPEMLITLRPRDVTVQATRAA